MPLGEVNIGPMRCSKTTHGVIVANTLLEADPKAKVTYVRPGVDTRGTPLKVASRSGLALSIPPFTTNDVDELFDHCQSFQLAIIDEGQMFKPSLAPIMLRLAIQCGVHVMYFGLDTTWKGELFATTAAACALPGFKVYCHKSHCIECVKANLGGSIIVRPTAIFSQKLRDGVPISVLDPNEPTFEPGDAQYEPLCWKHWFELTPGAHEALMQNRIGRIACETEWKERE